MGSSAFRLVSHGRVASTSDCAFAAIEAGEARHLDAHVAHEQTGGRGRRGRRWESPAGSGLYLSVILRPGLPAPPPAALTMTAGLALHKALDGLGAPDLALKWPNDLLARGRKLCGILVEARGLQPTDPIYVLGIGVNVTASPRVEPQPPWPPTHLLELGVETTVEAVREAVLGTLEPALREAWEDPAGVARRYAERLGLLGRGVRVGRGAELHTGVLSGLDLEGLRLAVEGGERRFALEHVDRLEDQAAVDPNRDPSL